MPTAPEGGDADSFDVVVVGSGPAGSSAAAEAAGHGARTLLVERAELPRYKTCGGGLIGIASSLVGDLEDVPVADRIDRVDFTLAGGRRRERTSRLPAWVFPKGDVLTVGVIAERGEPARTRTYLRDFCSFLGLADLSVVRSSGHLTRCRVEGSPLRRGRVLVAGDAAGLLEPWTREGISFALRSGRLAGRRAAEAALLADQASADAALEAYASDVEQSLALEMAAGLLCRRAFSAHPLVFHLIVGSTRAGWRFFGRFTRGETTLAGAVQRRMVRVPLRLLERRWRGRRTG